MLQEIDALVEEWEPVPLVPDIAEEDERLEPPVIERYGMTQCIITAALHAAA